MQLTDNTGQPLDPKALEGSGFTVAQVVKDSTSGNTKYQNLLVHDVEGKPYTEDGQTKQPALPKASQPYADSGGTWQTKDDGTVTYTFKNALSTSPDPNTTTVVGVYVNKDARASIANDVYTFLPAGGTPTVTQEVVTNKACESCHNPLEAHGGTRQEVGLCLSCHTDQNTDPETGNTLDFKVLIHKLHDGASLPSVAAGTPYEIVGYNQSVANFSDITWPQDVRNCTTCHSGGAQSDYYKTAPGVAACTSCHDNVNLATGDNHPGGKITDDSKCAACHPAEGQEFDASITGAHTIPLNSTQIKGVKLEIVSVEGAKAGGSPVVTFKVTDNSGKPIAPADMDYLALTLAGPTSDYVNTVTETINRKPTTTPPAVEDAGSGAYRYTFKYKIPADATGTYAVGMEGYVMETINGVKDPIRVAGFNPVTYLALDGGTPDPRRQVVDVKECDSCHKNLAAHGGIRQNTEYCVLCHTPTATDAAMRPVDTMPPASINFRTLIHSLHSGDALSQPLIIYGHGNSLNNFGDIAFPGNLADCQTCHLPGTYGLPLASGVQPTTITEGTKVVSSILPDQSVCTSCHDTKSVVAHAQLNTTLAGVESCSVCHGSGAEFDVTKVHQ
ncbi:MAG: OmcA/MtrC family decaheme c-type cytochrome [Chloroflexi bacterium]|nr:OmcA/MtrC family decaheme c-type cytochrome [Chloroflexota bacterium]